MKELVFAVRLHQQCCESQKTESNDQSKHASNIAIKVVL